MDEQVQKAVDCYNAGATVLHVHVREPDGKGSKRLSKFNELLDRLREAVPDMILQVGGSISFAPKAKARMPSGCPTTRATCWPNCDPKPDQVTIAINTNQMNIMDLITDEEYGQHQPGASPTTYHAYREMVVPAGPDWVEEHLRRLVAAGIQPHFTDRHARPGNASSAWSARGHYNGPLNLNWVGIGGGLDGPNPRNFMEFISRAPDGCDRHRGIG